MPGKQAVPLCKPRQEVAKNHSLNFDWTTKRIFVFLQPVQYLHNLMLVLISAHSLAPICVYVFVVLQTNAFCTGRLQH